MERPNSNNAVKFLEAIYNFLEKEKKLTMLAEICEDATYQGKKPDPFRILISTILSVRNKDESTAMATKKLFEEGGLNTPKKIAEAPIEKIEQLIIRSGMYKTKAQRIKETSIKLLEKFNGTVPNTLDELLELPGVGRKVANCVLVYAFNIPSIPVDIHVHRISNRTGLVKTKHPEETEQELMKLFPKGYWTKVNDTLVIFGKTICKPIGPKCDICPITKECPKLIEVKPKNKNKIDKKEPKNKEF